MKHFKQFLLVVLVTLASCISANAHDFESVSDGQTLYYRILTENTCAVTQQSSSDNMTYPQGNIVIPQTVEYGGKTFTVTEVDEYAFYRNQRIESVSFPNSIVAIRRVAFFECTDLTELNLPESLTEIGNDAFAYCHKITEVVIPDGVKSIGQRAFESWNLKKITLGKSVNEIGRNAFGDSGELLLINFSQLNLENGSSYYTERFGYAKLLLNRPIVDGSFYYEDAEKTRMVLFRGNEKDVVLPESVKEVGQYAFSFYGQDIESVKIPESVTRLGDSAFQDCKKLTAINIPSGLKEIEHALFWNCESLKDVSLPEGITTIGGCAFEGCICMTDIVIPQSVTTLEYGAFEMSGLNSVVIHDNIKEWEECAFYACESLKSVKIGNGVNNIPKDAFNDCTSLAEVYLSWNTPAGKEISSRAFSTVHKITLFVPIGTPKEYRYRSPWNNFKEIKEYVPGGNEGREKCAEPTLTVEDNKLLFSSSTPNCRFYYTIDCDDQTALSNSEGVVDLNATYKITVYAYAEGYDNSETVTTTLVWVNPTLEGDKIINIEAKKAVLIRSLGNCLQISGTERGEKIELYTVGGMQLNSVSANDHETVIPCNIQKGEIVIIKYGDKSIKYRL